MRRNIVLLVEDRDDEVELTLRAFAQAGLDAELVVVRDGQAALDYLFAARVHARRDPTAFPELVLLDMQLPS
ncbi:MAG TPA: hypothetical protein VIL20_11425 [Sandaracinaceae bacterium]